MLSIRVLPYVLIEDIVIPFGLNISVSANETTTNQYCFDEIGVDITFEEDNSLTEEQKAQEEQENNENMDEDENDPVMTM